MNNDALHYIAHFGYRPGGVVEDSPEIDLSQPDSDKGDTGNYPCISPQPIIPRVVPLRIKQKYRPKALSLNTPRVRAAFVAISVANLLEQKHPSIDADKVIAELLNDDLLLDRLKGPNSPDPTTASGIPVKLVNDMAKRGIALLLEKEEARINPK